MPRIKGKFCPLTDELGNDERFIIESTDLDKLMYVLVMYTCHMTYHKAPTDPRFYKIRYGLRSKTGQIAASIRRLHGLYKGLSWNDGKVSLINSATYRSEPVQKVLEEEEKKNKKKKESNVASLPAQDFIKTLKANDAYKGIDIDRELGKCKAWCLANQKQLNQRRFVNWLNRAEKPIHMVPAPLKTVSSDDQMRKWKAEAAPMPKECRDQLTALGIRSKV